MHLAAALFPAMHLAAALFPAMHLAAAPFLAALPAAALFSGARFAAALLLLTLPDRLATLRPPPPARTLGELLFVSVAASALRAARSASRWASSRSTPTPPSLLAGFLRRLPCSLDRLPGTGSSPGQRSAHPSHQDGSTASSIVDLPWTSIDLSGGWSRATHRQPPLAPLAPWDPPH
ncbi:hypothetical protein [Sorangium sp. So ce887]|uniref:hypothetical protein n=1 Tax=Sorangium sp. So ce887 TaxID=3133324 RepID=UPI003F627C39